LISFFDLFCLFFSWYENIGNHSIPRVSDSVCGQNILSPLSYSYENMLEHSTRAETVTAQIENLHLIAMDIQQEIQRQKELLQVLKLGVSLDDAYLKILSTSNPSIWQTTASGNTILRPKRKRRKNSRKSTTPETKPKRVYRLSISSISAVNQQDKPDSVRPLSARAYPGQTVLRNDSAES
jgi:hypothetical protein